MQPAEQISEQGGQGGKPVGTICNLKLHKESNTPVKNGKREAATACVPSRPYFACGNGVRAEPMGFSWLRGLFLHPSRLLAIATLVGGSGVAFEGGNVEAT